MAKDITITITQVVGGNYQPDTSLTQLNLRVSPFSSSTVAGTHIGDGVYKFENVEDGIYKLFNNTTEVTKWGGTNGRWIGDEALPYMGLSGGHWDADNRRIFNLDDPASDIDAISKGWADSMYQLQSDMVNYVTVGTAQTVSGSKGWTAFQTWSGGGWFSIGAGGSNYPKIYYEDELAGETYVAPTENTHIATRKFVLDQVTGITVPPAAYNTNEIIIIPSGTDHTGKIYNTIKKGTTYLTGIPVNFARRGVLYLRQERNSAFVKAEAGSIVDYVNWQGIAPAYLDNSGDYTTAYENLGTIVLVADGTANKKMTFKDLTLIFGNSAANFTGNSTGARSYQSMVFNNVVILAYNDVTFTDCIFHNCIIITSGAFKATCDQCKLITVGFNVEPTLTDCAPQLTYSVDEWDVPNDITAYVPA